jgi:ferric-dicitrate binding protein FerR (iron transport regulator)
LLAIGWFVGRERFPRLRTVAMLSGVSEGVLVRAASKGEWRAVQASRRLSRGAEVKTSSSAAAHLSLIGGATVTLGQNSRLQFPGAADGGMMHRLRLLSGSVAAIVPALGEAETLVVESAGHEVIAQGTEFSVSAAEDATAPCVVVHKGVVEVKGAAGSIRLRAGERAGCDLGYGEQTQSRTLQP